LSDPSYSVLRFGTEQHPVVVIDDYSPEFDRIFAALRTIPYGYAGPHYPGLRAPMRPDYLNSRAALLRDILSNVFDAPAIKIVECSASIVTTQPGDLTPIQRLPHFDTSDRNRLALLHYCCGEDSGGTSFYRHSETGYEAISEDRTSAYSAAIKDEADKSGLPAARYMAGSTDQFERIGQIEARPNRMAIYRSMCLHSGDIPIKQSLAPDPETARLTINTFVQARPAAGDAP